MSGWITCIVCYDHFWSDNEDPVCGAMCLMELEEQSEIDEMEAGEDERSNETPA